MAVTRVNPTSLPIGLVEEILVETRGAGFPDGWVAAALAMVQFNPDLLPHYSGPIDDGPVENNIYARLGRLRELRDLMYGFLGSGLLHVPPPTVFSRTGTSAFERARRALNVSGVMTTADGISAANPYLRWMSPSDLVRADNALDPMNRTSRQTNARRAFGTVEEGLARLWPHHPILVASYLTYLASGFAAQLSQAALGVGVERLEFQADPADAPDSSGGGLDVAPEGSISGMGAAHAAGWIQGFHQYFPGQEFSAALADAIFNRPSSLEVLPATPDVATSFEDLLDSDACAVVTFGPLETSFNPVSQPTQAELGMADGHLRWWVFANQIMERGNSDIQTVELKDLSDVYGLRTEAARLFNNGEFGRLPAVQPAGEGSGRQAWNGEMRAIPLTLRGAAIRATNTIRPAVTVIQGAPLLPPSNLAPTGDEADSLTRELFPNGIPKMGLVCFDVVPDGTGGTELAIRGVLFRDPQDPTKVLAIGALSRPDTPKEWADIEGLVTSREGINPATGPVVRLTGEGGIGV